MVICGGSTPGLGSRPRRICASRTVCGSPSKMLKPARSDAVQKVGRDGSSRLRFCLRVATWCCYAAFDVVLEMHVFGKSVRACERFIALGELASEGFLTRVGSDVRHKCEARGLREATRGPFTGVVGSERAGRRTSWSIGSVGWV